MHQVWLRSKTIGSVRNSLSRRDAVPEASRPPLVHDVLAVESPISLHWLALTVKCVPWATWWPSRAPPDRYRGRGEVGNKAGCAPSLPVRGRLIHSSKSKSLCRRSRATLTGLTRWPSHPTASRSCPGLMIGRCGSRTRPRERRCRCSRAILARPRLWLSHPTASYCQSYRYPNIG
jgi:hypothetical protein